MSQSAESEIRNLISRYASAIVTHDAEIWGSTWAEEGIWELIGHEAKGRSAVVEHWERLTSGLDFVFQIAGQADIQLEAGGKRGTGQAGIVEFAQFKGGTGALTLGTYHDVYLLEGGVWKFGERRLKLHYMGAPDVSGQVAS
jgi:hypothetical protein